MITGFTVPTIYTAIDKFSATLRTMGRNAENFASKVEARVSRADRLFRKITPSLGEAQKQLLSFASTAAIAGGIIAGISFSWNSLKEYETALASLRTITGLSTQEFTPFKNQILSVAKDTKESAIEVAKSFELIASANADLLKSPEQLAAVSRAAILLSQASGMAIDAAAGSLTNAMNQFGVGAEKASEFVNILVQSQAAGTATIQQLADSMVVAGGTAKAFGLDFDKTNALLQGFAKGGKVGSEAGTQLSGILSKLSKSANKNFNPVFTDATKVIDNLAKAHLSYTDLMKLTDAEGAKWLTTIINQNDTVQALAGNLNVSNAATEAAAKQNDTLAIAAKQAQNAFVNLLVSNNELNSGLNFIKKSMQFVAKNMDTIVTIGVGILTFFAAWKAGIIATQIALGAYNIILGINGALSGVASIAIGQNTIALGAYKFALGIVTAAQWLWNTAMAANPIALIAATVIALTALVIVAAKKWNEWGAALAVLLGPLGMILSIVQSFRRNWEMITKAFSEGGILEGIKAIGITLLDAVIMPLQQVLEIISKLTGFDWASDAAKSLAAFRKDMGVNVTTDENGKSLTEKPLINPEAQKQDALVQRMETSQKQKVSIDINDKTGRAKVNSDNDFVPIKLTSTLGF
jgi:TP901 family phage tail tape measure protein